jgi:hypothetical protein
MFTQMNFTERAAYLGLRSKGKPKAQATLEYANFLRATAQTSLAAMEASASALYSEAQQRIAARRAQIAQDDYSGHEYIEWINVFPAVKQQGSEDPHG